MAARMLGRSAFYIGQKRPRVPSVYRQYQRSKRPVCSLNTNGGPGLHWRLLSTDATENNTDTMENNTDTKDTREWIIPPPEAMTLDDPVDGDEYSWMHRSMDSYYMVAHLERENAYSDAVLKPLRSRSRQLYRGMMKRQPEDEGGEERSVPERMGPFLYYTRREEGKQFNVYVRRPVEGDVENEQVVLDLNEIQARGLSGIFGDLYAQDIDEDDGGKGTVAEKTESATDDAPPPLPPRLRTMKLSSDHRMLACTIDFGWTDRHSLVVFELGSVGAPGTATAKIHPVMRHDHTWNDVVGVEWGSSLSNNDSDSNGAGGVGGYELYYTVPDELRRPWQVRRVLVRPSARDETQSTEEQEDKEDETSPAWTYADGGGGDSRWEADISTDAPVFEELDDAFFADVGKTKDGAFVVVNVHSKTASEVLFMPTNHATTPTDSGSRSGPQSESTVSPEDSSCLDTERGSGGRGNSATSAAATAGRAVSDLHEPEKPVLLRKREEGVEYYVDHAGDSFYLVTNSRPYNGAAFKASPEPRSAWQRVTKALSGDVLAGVKRYLRGEDGEKTSQEYRLTRVRQNTGTEGLRPLEGIADAPWEPIPLEFSDSSSSGTNTASQVARNKSIADFKKNEESSTLGIHDGGDKSSVNSGDPKDNVEGGASRGVVDGGALRRGEQGAVIEEMDVFRGHCLLYEISAAGLPRLRVVPHADPKSGFVVSPPTPGGSAGDSSTDPAISPTADSAAVLRPGVNSWFDSKKARFTLSSPTAPEDLYDLCLETGGMELLRRTKVPGEPRFDAGDYSCYRVQVPSRDEEMVPLTIVHRKDLELDGNNRLLLQGYGAYGMNIPLDYNAGHTCMLEEGWVLAFAHVRGGGERGKAWHARGRRQHKWNSFYDFEACAEHLVSSKFTSSAKMGLHVSSAGGLLAGVMANTRPDLFSAMVMKAPFLGVLSAMRDTSLPLTVHEFDEWGNPSENREVEEMIKSYSPYDNVKLQHYPPMLVSTSLNDNRVSYWDPAKWVARVRAQNMSSNPILLRVSGTDAHDGPHSADELLEDYAVEMAFLEKHLGGQ